MTNHNGISNYPQTNNHYSSSVKVEEDSYGVKYLCSFFPEQQLSTSDGSHRTITGHHILLPQVITPTHFPHFLTTRQIMT